MKKSTVVISVILATIIIGIFLINEKEENTDVTEVKTKVGVIMIGNIDDKSYNQSHYEGLEKTAEKLNLEVIYKESVPVDGTCKQVIDELIASGSEIIICNSYNYGKWIQKAAEENPDIYFFHASGVEYSKNLATYFGRIYQMRYLSGIVAGLQTETNEIGYVAAFPISEVNRGINAFTLGAKSVNPDVIVHVEWCNSWTDDEAAGEATEKLIDQYNIDVLAMHSDSIRPLEIAEEKGVWSIGYNIDNSENFPKTFLTAPVWQWENYYESYILKCLQGKFTGKHYWEGISTGVVGLAPLTSNVNSKAELEVSKAMDGMIIGSFDVFYGPVVDIEGTVRVREGENMSDDSMLNEFDWYVEGVVVHE